MLRVIWASEGLLSCSRSISLLDSHFAGDNMVGVGRGGVLEG